MTHTRVPTKCRYAGVASMPVWRVCRYGEYAGMASMPVWRLCRYGLAEGARIFVLFLKLNLEFSDPSYDPYKCTQVSEN